MNLTAYQNVDKTTRAWVLHPDKTVLVNILYIKILIRHIIFFFYVNIFPSQFEALFGLPRDLLFIECFWRRSINSRVVLYRLRLVGLYRLRASSPLKSRARFSGARFGARADCQASRERLGAGVREGKHWNIYPLGVHVGRPMVGILAFHVTSRRPCWCTEQ